MVRLFTSFSLSSSLTSTRALSYSASYSTWTQTSSRMIAQNYGHCFKQINCSIWLTLFQPPGVLVEILRSAQACFDKRSSTREEASVQNLIWLMFIFKRKIWQHLVDVHFCHLSLSLGWYQFYFALLLTIPMKINSSSLFLRTFFLVFKTEAHHNNVVISRGTMLFLHNNTML